MRDFFKQFGTDFYKHVSTKGIRYTARKAATTLWHMFRDLFSERRYRTRTGGVVQLQSLSIDSPNKRHGQYYIASQYAVVEGLLNQLGPDFSAHTLVDFGCGKGRVLLVAAELGFKKVIGVEFSLELCEIANGNLSVYGEKRKTDFEIVHTDATEYEIPINSNVFYFYNPFGPVILDRVMANIAASLKSAPRSVRIIYANALHSNVIESYGFRLEYTLERGSITSHIYIAIV